MHLKQIAYALSLQSEKKINQCGYFGRELEKKLTAHIPEMSLLQHHGQRYSVEKWETILTSKWLFSDSVAQPLMGTSICTL